jgi:CheY-like chemotaxis protein
MYARYLQHEGLSVCQARSPATALKALRHIRPDVVVTDYVFPRTRIDGPAFIRQVRKISQRTQPTIIVVSGLVRQEDAQRARAAGADLFLLKPCLPEDLLADIMRAGGINPGHSSSTLASARAVARKE